MMSKLIIQFNIQKHCLFPPIKNNNPSKVLSNFLPVIPIPCEFSSTKVFTLKIFSLILTLIFINSKLKDKLNKKNSNRDKN